MKKKDDLPKDKCYYCERKFGYPGKGEGLSATPIKKSKDHIIPVSRGGISAPANYVYACVECNMLKSGRTPDEFAIFLGAAIDKPSGIRGFTKKRLLLMLTNSHKLVLVIAPYRDDLIMISKPEPDWEPIIIPKLEPSFNKNEFVAYKGIETSELNWFKQWKQKYDKEPDPDFHEK